jgi:hypothetical protein
MTTDEEGNRHSRWLGAHVRTVTEASEDEVILAFLQAEIDSERHAPKMLKALRADGRPRSLVDSAVLEDPGQNAYRRSLLGRVRGWARGEGMFQGFPARGWSGTSFDSGLPPLLVPRPAPLD